MKSNVNKEDTDAKKKYVFFSDPDVIVRRAESTAAGRSVLASQALQNLKVEEQQWRGDSKVTQSEPESSGNAQTKSDLKGLETLLSYHPVQPYPFTFITAVKRKLALSMHAEACKRAYDPEKLEKPETDVDLNRSNTDFRRNVNQTAQKMDFIKPLKVPDLKISPKTLDYSSRESLAAKDIVQPAGSLSSKKLDIHALEDAVSAGNKSPKSCEKANRKLDFSLLEGSPIKSCENIEPLRAPDLSIGSGLSKKKEHARDSSREKENRSKRIKKDDSSFARRDDALKETPRRSKSSKHLSRKDVEEETDSIFEMFRPENFLSNAPRESDFGFKKPKSKNFLTSTVKKNDDRKNRSISMQSVRSTRERSLESKNRNYENDSNSEKSLKTHDRITTRDSSRGNAEQSHKMSNQDFSTLRQCDENKYKNPGSSSSKQQKHSAKTLPQGQAKQFENYSKTQVKKSYENQKPSTSEPETKDLNTASDISEEIKTVSGSMAGLKDAVNLCRIDATSETDDSLRNDTPLQQPKSNEGSREVEKSCRNSQTSSKTDKFHDNPEVLSQAENSLTQGTNTDSRIIEDSTNQVDANTSSSKNKSYSDCKNSQSKSLSGIILDPTRISFRDENYEEQNEFCDLVTPDMNLLPRSKRRKNFVQEEDNGTDLRSPKHQPANNVQSKDEGIQLLHPTALHMQFQAELHLLDSFNESLRQVMDVENCLYGAKHEQDQGFLLKQKENKIRRKNLVLTQTGRDTVDIERHQGNQSKNVQDTTNKNDFTPHQTDEQEPTDIEVMNTGIENQSIESAQVLDRVKQSQNITRDSDYVLRKNDRISVRVTEVQTQTANDIATQTETPRVRRRHSSPGRQVPGITYQRGSPPIEEIPQLSLESFDQFEDFDQIENVSLPSRMHTMSEISLHETTSSIRTETGTEISISTRDVTCSFNKYLDSELAQLIKDEKQRYDEIEMLFKSREKTLNDRTKKLVKLEEQKRALRDMGQDSRISSVKKKQRALLLKLQQEKDEMNRLKELHKKASQERKLMLQKQRNMLNPQMSTKNILTKLKRSADSQSPRRLSGPMKGYDIRSPSSMSSLVDSDKSQLDRSHVETKASIPDVRLYKSEGRIPRSDVIASAEQGRDIKSLKAEEFDNGTEQSDASLINLSPGTQKFITKQQKIQNTSQKSDAKSKYETKPCKYKEVMPKIDDSHHKSHGPVLESNTSGKKSMKSDTLANLDKSKLKETQQKPASVDLDKSISENIRSESDTLVDDFSKKSKSSQATEINFDNLKPKREKETILETNIFDSENLNTESDSIAEELSSKKSKLSQAPEDISEVTSKNSKKTQNASTISKETFKKSQGNAKTKSNSKRKGSRNLKSKSSSSDILSENILRSKSSSQISEEIMKHHSKRSKIENEEAQSEENYQNPLANDMDANESQSSLHALVKHSRAVKEKNYQLLRNIANEHEAKENMSRKDLESIRNASGRQDGNLPNVGNMSTRSQVSTLTISHHSSGESEKSYSRSVVIRAQDHHFRTTKKLEQILTAREAALASRRSCVEEWIAWHSRLRAEESRVARMEEAAFKLVSAASNALSYHDTTVSSDTSDVESRIEILAEKLAERRTEMARLKREAKRQAKQRLKALETNLLNQIKKYDTTIHEMRKKLENKRGALFNDGSSEKLAIESKSLTDFKIPDIPIKRIKEIYKNSDLLKSRSESSLISENNQRKDSDNLYRRENSEHDNTSYRKSPRSTPSDATDHSEISNSEKKATTQSIQSIFEDVRSTASREPDFVSENIESQSISEKIEANDYSSHGRSSDKSEDEISNVGSKSKSDQDTNETEYSNSREIRKRKPLEIRPEIDNEKQTIISQTKLSQDSIISGASRASSNHESDSILENIQRADSVREIETESIRTVPEVKLSRSYDISIQESTSNFVPSEVLSDTEQRDSGGMTEQNSSIRATSNNATTEDYVFEKSSATKDGDLSKSESHQLSSPKIVSPKTVNLRVQSDDSPSEIHVSQELTKHKESDELSVTALRSASENDPPRTLADDASASKVSSVIDEISVDKSCQKSKSISNQLSFLELGNKNLNDDISTLENDLKALSEMMSQFSKKSDSKLRSDIILENEEKTTNFIANDSDKATSEDITDIDYPNEVGDQVNSNHNATYIVEEERRDSELNDKDLTAQVTEIMLKIMPENVTLPPGFNGEIDFKARSREILNEIEKSIISEHVKSPESPTSPENNLKIIETNVSSLEDKNEGVIDDPNSFENDIMSIAEIISHASEAKRGIKMIQTLGHDHLFEDDDEGTVEVELSPNSYSPTFEEPGIILHCTEQESFEIPSSNLPGKFEEDENAHRANVSESKQSLESSQANSEDVNTRNVTRNLVATSTTNLEQTDTMFETIKDPEYEDISEESLEVSEIMDRSESQRSDRQSYQKPGRLPEKYQMTQKSEDVLRILDEISQTSSDSSLRSQQFFLAPNNHGKKIDELLQRSERLSQNFEALTKKKPSQPDVTVNLPIAAYQKSSEKPVPRQEMLSKHPEENLRPIDTIEQTNDLSQKSDKQRYENILHNIEIPISSDTLPDCAIEDVCRDTRSLNEPGVRQARSEKEGNSTASDTFVASFDKATRKVDDSLQRSNIQRQNIDEMKREAEILTEKLVDTRKTDETSPGAREKSKFQLQDAGKFGFDENLSRTELLEDKTAQPIGHDSRDKTAQKSDESIENFEEIPRVTEIGILSAQENVILELSKYPKTDEVSKENLIGSEASNDDRTDAIVLKSDDELQKFNVNSSEVDVSIREVENISLTPRSDESLLRKCEEKLHEIESKRDDEYQPQRIVSPDVISNDSIETSDKSEEFNVKPQHIDNTIDPFRNVSPKIEEIPDPVDLSRPFGALSPKSEDSLNKINAAEKSDCASQKSDESQGSEKSEDILHKYEVELPSESSEEVDTPRSVSEIEMDSPRDPNDSRLDIDGLDDDLLGNDNNFGTQNADLRAEFHAAPVVATSEKDIEAMIDKLKVSLEQPGLDVAELEAKLLRIQQLQIELEIKKLEAEEVSYYVREIPNKPPPPYTPPSGGRLSVSQTSPSPAPAVVPTNVEDLTSFTERATHLIYQAKESGDDIINLEPPTEICELSKDNNETARRDRKIYNTFLFDLCKETISEVYQSEYEKPGPSWLKPNAKTKPTMKVPKTVEGLNDYVSKEVATLFGFKTKLQRENLVMRWSRKRRDRVDELLAREAQAEEDEWTKFHHDELAVKNELTTAILDSLILDAANVVKLAYIKKRKVTS